METRCEIIIGTNANIPNISDARALVSCELKRATIGIGFNHQAGPRDGVQWSVFLQTHDATRQKFFKLNFLKTKSSSRVGQYLQYTRSLLSNLRDLRNANSSNATKFGRGFESTAGVTFPDSAKYMGRRDPTSSLAATNVDPSVELRTQSVLLEELQRSEHGASVGEQGPVRHVPCISHISCAFLDECRWK